MHVKYYVNDWPESFKFFFCLFNVMTPDCDWQEMKDDMIHTSQLLELETILAISHMKHCGWHYGMGNIFHLFEYKYTTEIYNTYHFSCTMYLIWRHRLATSSFFINNSLKMLL